jgi:hypothetical protein
VGFESMMLRKTFEVQRKEILGGKQSFIASVDTMNWYKRSKILTPLIHDFDIRQNKYRNVGENYIKMSFVICIPAKKKIT